MIFQSIKLYNFRQYKAEHKFEFSDSKQKNITLIIGDIGAGKTTFLQAFRYCFYGASSNYLNLPRSNDLINFNIADNLKEMEVTKIFVEVEFKHKSNNYLVKREQKYIKKNNRLISHGFEEFSISESTSSSGFKTFRGEEALERMTRILPPGLSYVFMFDGERVEKNISSNESRVELKEAVLGILGIKKIDALLDYIGAPGKNYGNTVFKYINNKNPETSKEDKETIDKRDILLDILTKKEEDKIKYDKILSNANEDLNKISLIQTQIEKNKENINRRNELKKKEESINREIDDLSNEYIKESGTSILFKMLLLSKNKYDQFIAKNDSANKFYHYLHKDTLDDVLSRQICICGRDVKKHSEEEKVIHSLYSTALPIESSHHLSKISSEFLRATDFNAKKELLNQKKNKIIEKKAELRDTTTSLKLLNSQILEFEQEYGESTQIRYNEIIDTIAKASKELGTVENDLKSASKALAKLKPLVDKIERKDDNFNKIIQIREDLESIYMKLDLKRKDKDLKARKVLSKYFSENVNQVLSKKLPNGEIEDYTADIDEKYNLIITNNNNKRDVTDVLSKGQSVVISLSFLKSLISTTKEMSDIIDDKQRYGVIMDAALSNLSEKAVKLISESNIIKLDQLIFLSFKKQLRDEMYGSIKNNIGKAYYIERNGSDLNQTEIEIKNLDEFIHMNEGEKNETK